MFVALREHSCCCSTIRYLQSNTFEATQRIVFTSSAAPASMKPGKTWLNEGHGLLTTCNMFICPKLRILLDCRVCPSKRTWPDRSAFSLLPLDQLFYFVESWFLRANENGQNKNREEHKSLKESLCGGVLHD